MPRTADDFLKEISERPDDDALKAVFSDWLLERGDVRGELIALQLKIVPSDEDRSREMLLMNRYVDRWLPAEVLINLDRPTIEFERGMFSAARVAVRSQQAMAASLFMLAWSTVRRLASPPAELVESCPLLTQLTDVDDFTVSMLAAREKPLERLTTLGVLGRSTQVLGRAFASDAFARVRELRLGLPMSIEGRDEDDVRRTARHFEPGRLEWLFTSALGRRLKRLVLHTGWIDLMPWLGHLEATQVEIQLTPMVFEPTNWWIRFVPGRRAVIFPGSELNASFSEGPVREILATMPRGWFKKLELPEHLGWSSVRRLPCFERAE